MPDEHSELKARIDGAHGYACLNRFEVAVLQASIPHERVHHLSEGDVYEVPPYSSVVVQGCNLYDFAYDRGKVTGPAIIGVVRNTGLGGLHHRLTLEIRKIERRHRSLHRKRWAMVSVPLLVLSLLLLILGGEGGWPGVLVIAGLQVLLYVLSQWASRMEMPIYRPSERLDDWTARVREVDVPVVNRRKSGSATYAPARPQMPSMMGDQSSPYWMWLAMETSTYSSEDSGIDLGTGISSGWERGHSASGGSLSTGGFGNDHASGVSDNGFGGDI